MDKKEKCNSEKADNIKTTLANAGVIAIVMIILVVLLFALFRKPKEEAVETMAEPYPIEEERYSINSRSLVEFSDVIVEQFREESKLLVSSVDATISMELKQNSGWDIGILTKTQKINYQGTGKFYVDLSMMGPHSLHLDEDSQTITIEIPHASMEPLEIDPTRFTCEEVENGLLAFGDLKFTPQEFNDLQTTCKLKLEKEINTEANRNAADERAVEEMMKIYEPIVKTVDDDYSVEITFMGYEAAK